MRNLHPTLRRPQSRAPRTSALNKTGDASCLKGGLQWMGEGGGEVGGAATCMGLRNCSLHWAFMPDLTLIRCWLAHCTLRVLTARTLLSLSLLSLLSPLSTHAHTVTCFKNFELLLQAAFPVTQGNPSDRASCASLWPLAAATCHTTWQQCRQL